MYIDNVHRVNRITTARLVNEIESWGVSRSDADTLVSDLLERSSEAIAAAREDTPRRYQTKSFGQ